MIAPFLLSVGLVHLSFIHCIVNSTRGLRALRSTDGRHQFAPDELRECRHQTYRATRGQQSRIDIQRLVGTYIIWGIVSVDLDAVEEEPDGGAFFALPLTERAHQLVQLRGLLDLEENFVVAIGDLDVQMLACTRRILLSAVW